MSLLRKALLLNFTSFLCLFIGMVQNVIFSRMLGPEGIGQYAVINSTMMLGTQLVCFGYPMAYLYYSQRDPSNMKYYLMNSIYSTLLLGVLGGISLITIIILYPNYFGSITIMAVFFIAIYVPIVLERVISRNYLLIEIQAFRLGIKNILAMCGSLSLAGIFIYLGFLTVSNAIICFVLAASIRFLLGWIWMRKAIDFDIRPELPTIYKLGKMGIRQSWADLMVILNAQISIMVVRYLINDFESVGFFSRGLRIAMLIVTAGQAVLPILFSKWASMPENCLADNIEKVIRFLVATGVLMFIFLLFSGKWIILFLYGNEFLPAVKPMNFLIPGTVLYLLSSSLMQLFGARGKPEYTAILLGISTVLNLLLSWVLIPKMSIIGASIASTISNIFLLLSLITLVIKNYNIKLLNCLFLKNSDFRSIKNAFFSRIKNNV